MILLISPKSAHATGRFIDESRNLHIPVETLDVHDLARRKTSLKISQYSALYIRQAYPHFNGLIELGRAFWEAGKYVVDSQAILNGFETGRLHMYDRLRSAGIPIPLTSSCQALSPQLQVFPHILKWNYGFGGTSTYLVQSSRDARAVVSQRNEGEWLAQEYIAADFEYKVVTIGYKSLPKVLRFRISDLGFKVDLQRYSIFDADQLPEVVALAEKSAQILGRELSKTDILQKDGKLYVLETNRSPGFLPIEPYLKMNIAGKFLEYISQCSTFPL